MAEHKISDELIEEGRKLFSANCKFIKSVVNYEALPLDSEIEIAFAGRSNVGKSSLINSISNQKSLARVSNTPGRTQQLNFFDLSSKGYLVDLPGYGYARATKSDIIKWQQLIIDYLKGRPQLRRVFLLIDSRHGIKKNDIEIMDILDNDAISYQIILTKLDKLKKNEIDKIINKVNKDIKKHPASHPNIISSSSKKNIGIDIIRAEIANILS